MRLSIIMTFLVSSLLTFAQENIEFQYTMKRDSVDSSLIRIEAKIINRANEKIYFLSESCNGLDYYLKTNVSNIEPYIMIHCNASYPRKIKINPRSEYIFHSLIRDEKELKEIGLTLTFVQLNSTTKVEGRSINEIKKEYLNQTLNLKGKMVELK